jgi:hypothetical protein
MDQSAAFSRPKPGKKVELNCDCGCGTLFYRYRHRVNPSLNFVNGQHHGDYTRQKYLRELCGHYLPIVTEYLDSAAKQRYEDLPLVRCSICPFFRYLCEVGIDSLQEVIPSTVSDFKLWGLKNG